MKNIWFVFMSCSVVLVAGDVWAKTPDAGNAQKYRKTAITLPEQSPIPRENVESWVPSSNCDSRYYDVLPASDPESGCRDILKVLPQGKKAVHYYTCRFKNDYPQDDACYGAKITRMGLESYSCEANSSITKSRNPCAGNYTVISEWHGDIDKDLTNNYPYGFICRADWVPPVCLAPKYEFAYRNGADHCCILYKDREEKTKKTRAAAAEDY